MARNITTVVIGAGHAGLAMSQRLSARSIDHVVLERGEVANTWKTRAVGLAAAAHPQLAEPAPRLRLRRRRPRRLHDDARGHLVHRAVRRGRRRPGADRHDRHPGAAERRTDTSSRPARAAGTRSTVVVATGACNVAHLPPFAADVPAGIDTLTPTTYRNPDQLADGGVLVVGASATGIQLADEIHRSGRPVTRGRRRPRARPAGLPRPRHPALDGRHRHDGRALRRGRRHRQAAPAPVVADRRHTGADDARPQRPDERSECASSAASPGSATGGRSSPGRCATCARWPISSSAGCSTRSTSGRPSTASTASSSRRGDPHRRSSRTHHRWASTSPAAEIRTIVWATGFRPDYSWLDVPVLDRKGLIRHDGGVVVDAPGMYLLGMPFLRRRKSTLIDGAGDDAEDLSAHLAVVPRRPCRSTRLTPAATRRRRGSRSTRGGAGGPSTSPPSASRRTAGSTSPCTITSASGRVTVCSTWRAAPDSPWSWRRRSARRVPASTLRPG